MSYIQKSVRPSCSIESSIPENVNISPKGLPIPLATRILRVLSAESRFLSDLIHSLFERRVEIDALVNTQTVLHSTTEVSSSQPPNG